MIIQVMSIIRVPDIPKQSLFLTKFQWENPQFFLAQIMVFTCELGQANACLKKLRIVLEYEAPYKSLYCSRACSIGEADTVTITGGAHSLKRVTRYKQDGTFESLAKLNYGRFEHACGHFSRSDGSVVCFELCREC